MPTTTGCAEKTRLLEEVRTAMSAILSLHNLEMEAVVGGNLEELEALQASLRQQRQIKDELVFAYKTHLEAHGC